MSSGRGYVWRACTIVGARENWVAGQGERCCRHKGEHLCTKAYISSALAWFLCLMAFRCLPCRCSHDCSIRVVAEVFEGKRSVERQRMVYKAIWEELQGAVHAVDSLVTLAPNET